MKVVIIGGTGLIGSKVVANLERLGHQALAAAPNTGVNTITGEGLAEALDGAQAVVDVANSPSFEDAAAMAFFRTAGTNLLAAEQSAGVGHHVALSVVGTDRLQASGYFRAKLVQEDLIKASTVPYTILRSTQFFPFIEGIIKSGAVDGQIHLPAALAQPIHADDVVAALAEIAVGRPANATLEIAGPKAIAIARFAEEYLSAKGDARPVVADPKTPYFGALLEERSQLPLHHPRLGKIRLEEWMCELIPAD
jgi:uncharacterized protein YbjT (DUF2867 family)